MLLDISIGWYSHLSTHDVPIGIRQAAFRLETMCHKAHCDVSFQIHVLAAQAMERLGIMPEPNPCAEVNYELEQFFGEMFEF